MLKPIFAYSLSAAGVLVAWNVPAQAQLYDWNGFHVGASAGVISLDGNVALTYPAGTPAPDTVYFNGGVPIFSSEAAAGAIPFPDAAQLAGLGALAAINFGYDMQQGVIVLGGEAEANFLIGGLASFATGDVVDAVNGRTHSVTVSGGIDQLYSAKARVGVAIDRLLLFGTGGLAVGHANLSAAASLIDNGYFTGNADWQGRLSSWRLGFVAGLGAEYALTDNLTVKLEGQYYNLGTMAVTADGTGSYGAVTQTVSPFTANLDLSGTIIKGGINLRF